MRWRDKLTKDEWEHMRHWVGNTVREMKHNREVQAGIKAERDVRFPDMDNEPCWMCRNIAKKLGIE